MTNNYLAKAYEMRDKLNKSGKSNTHSNFAVVHTNSDLCTINRGRACYAEFDYDNYYREGLRFVINHCTLMKKKRQPFWEPYIDWWINRSFVANAFVTKNAKEVLKEGAILKCTYPASYIVTAMTGMRYLEEHPDIPENWFILQNYMNNDAAIILAHYITKEYKYWVKYNPENSNHVWWNSDFGKDGFTRIVNHDFSKFNKFTPMNKSSSYRCLHKIWTGNDTDKWYERRDNYQKVELPPKSDYIEKNSFGYPIEQIKGYPPDNIQQVALQFFVTNYLGNLSNA